MSETGQPFEAALSVNRAGNLFTTHTAVAAGFDRFAPALIAQVQALDRTQPGLPMKPGRAATMTHDYKRNGTTTLFAAMNTLDGTLISRCEQAIVMSSGSTSCAR